ncbi:MAG: cytochrome d ubiquinol oxidase subunit II [Bryobacteraceae bacterium]|nr:cytochrome d ubiquinol oxidase subunit II [Bryobacteraceae bacterium]MDW8376529.1 cytochrome d ubiquinol oxidase subunit II [Bryobacterales bacterium]
METTWFWLTAFLITGYVVLDGFDLGAGVVHLYVAQTDGERQQVLKSIGPVWDGNEVWLLAGGGTLYFAFPKLYASSFSGFYLPLMIVLWLLILRGIALEFRNHLANDTWRPFWDVTFSLASTLLCVFFGAALGNVVRGVPLDERGEFFLPLWTNFTTKPAPGILDWYTILVGLLAFVCLSIHGAIWVAQKTSGAVHQRAHRLAKVLLPAVVVLTAAVTAATFQIQPHVASRFRDNWVGWVFPLLALAGLAFVWRGLSLERYSAAFVASTFYLVGMLGAVAFGLFPNVLPATDPARSLTIYQAAAAPYGLRVGLFWWLPGMAMALGYTAFLYRRFAGKVSP